MAPVVALIDALKHVAETVNVARLVSVREEPGLIAVLPVYLAAFVWLAHRWTTHRRLRHRRRSRGLRRGIGLLGFLSDLASLALGLLFATARAAGRSTFHSGARF